MIHRREFGTEVLHGISLSSNDQYFDVYWKTHWFCLQMRWVKPERRLIFDGYRRFSFWPIGPWRRVRELEREVARAERRIAGYEFALKQSADRYDRIRDANHQLRETLTLYRSEA